MAEVKKVLVILGIDITPIRQVPLVKVGVVELPEGVHVKALDTIAVDGSTHALLDRLLKMVDES